MLNATTRHRAVSFLEIANQLALAQFCGSGTADTLSTESGLGHRVIRLPDIEHDIRTTLIHADKARQNEVVSDRASPVLPVCGLTAVVRLYPLPHGRAGLTNLEENAINDEAIHQSLGSIVQIPIIHIVNYQHVVDGMETSDELEHVAMLILTPSHIRGNIIRRADNPIRDVHCEMPFFLVLLYLFMTHATAYEPDTIERGAKERDYDVEDDMTHCVYHYVDCL